MLLEERTGKPSAHSCICSDHFEEKCFVVRPGSEGRKLTQNAVPTIFPVFPTYYQKPMNAGRTLVSLASEIQQSWESRRGRGE